jgi:hypothetical protein
MPAASHNKASRLRKEIDMSTNVTMDTLKQNVQRALEELVDATTRYEPDSEEVNLAKAKRANQEKALADFVQSSNR